MPRKKKIEYYIENFANYSVRLPWKFFVKILKSHYGCEMKNKRGSTRLFIKGEIRVTADEPHGREKYVSKKDRERVIKYLINKLDL